MAKFFYIGCICGESDHLSRSCHLHSTPHLPSQIKEVWQPNEYPSISLNSSHPESLIQHLESFTLSDCSEGTKSSPPVNERCFQFGHIDISSPSTSHDEPQNISCSLNSIKPRYQSNVHEQAFAPYLLFPSQSHERSNLNPNMSTQSHERSNLNPNTSRPARAPYKKSCYKCGEIGIDFIILTLILNNMHAYSKGT